MPAPNVGIQPLNMEMPLLDVEIPMPEADVNAPDDRKTAIEIENPKKTLSHRVTRATIT